MSQAGGDATADGVDAYLAAGLQALRHEKFELAVEHLEAAAAADPDDARPPTFLSGAYLAVGRPFDAEAAVEEALRLDPDGFGPRLKAGELAMRFGDIGRAEREFLAALRAAPAGSPEADVARRWLVIARDRIRQSISLRAALPHLPGPLVRLRDSLRGGAPFRTPRAAQTTLGQLIAAQLEEDHR